jgi:protein required for attachment to host cells
MTAIHVIVADSARADFYEMDSATARLRKIRVMTNPAARKHERDLASGAPGRVLNRMGGVRHALQQHQTPKEHAAAKFSQALARAIAADVGDHRFLLVAAPRLLGAIRRPLAKLAGERIIGELPRDLIDLPRAQLQQRVQEQLTGKWLAKS